MNTQVVDIDFNFSADKKTATVLHTIKTNEKQEISLAESDYVFISNGSITESTANGSWTTSPVLKDKSTSGAWMLWDKIAKKDNGKKRVC